MFRPQIAVTLGDPRGIGPEVSREAIDTLESEGLEVTLIVVGPDGVVDHYGPAATAAATPVPAPPSDADAGSTSARSIERAVEMALSGDVHAIVTGPVHKPSLRAGGWDGPGPTEMLGGLAGVDEACDLRRPGLQVLRDALVQQVRLALACQVHGALADTGLRGHLVDRRLLVAALDEGGRRRVQNRLRLSVVDIGASYAQPNTRTSHPLL